MGTNGRRGKAGGFELEADRRGDLGCLTLEQATFDQLQLIIVLAEYIRAL